MKVQATEQGGTTAFYDVKTQGQLANFEDVFVATQQQQEVAQEATQEKVRELSFKEMVALEHKAIVALRQGDLIGHERYVKELSGYQGALERVNAAAEAEAVEANMNNGIFPEDAPKSVKRFVSGLSLKERMMLFTQVAVQEIIANAYQDANGHWHVRYKDEPGYVDIFEQPDFSYTELVEKMLAHLELNRKYMTKQDYADQLSLLLNFKEAAEGY